ncbi:MAG: hypothetical protein VXW84_15280, partial [Verrucomicrobiota bacterium]|nr:hypothetical protein [Verrucomicrobiota bacterium]
MYSPLRRQPLISIPHTRLKRQSDKPTGQDPFPILSAQLIYQPGFHLRSQTGRLCTTRNIDQLFRV